MDKQPKMRSSVDGMSVQEERQLLTEIRRNADHVTNATVLSNGMTAGEFALLYVQGHHQKRQLKLHRKIMVEQPDQGVSDLACYNGV
jgi:hypothetical protein